MKDNKNILTEENTTPIQAEEMVSVPKAWLENLESRVGSLEGRPIKLKQVTDHFAFIRIYDENVVKGVKKFWYEKAGSVLNDLDERRLFAELDIENYNKSVKVDWLNFLNDGNNKFKVKILSQKAKELSESHGIVPATNFDEHFNKSFSKDEVDLEVISYEYVCTVEIVEGDLIGKTFEINSNSLNI